MHNTMIRSVRRKQMSVYFAILVAVATCCLFGLLTACTPEAQQELPDAQEGRPVKMLVLHAADATPPLSFPAVIRSAESAELAFNVSGVLTELAAVEGLRVEQGTVIARLDDRDVRTRLEADTAAFELAKSNFERARQLAEAEIIAAAELDQLRAAYESARATLTTTRKSLDDMVLRAPFDGVVSHRYVNNFQNIQAKQAIVLFQSPHRLEVVAEIPEPLVLRSTRAEDRPDTALVRFNAFPDLEIPARFKEVSTEANPRTQTFQVVFSMERPENAMILPGVTATLIIERGAASETPVFVLPPLALVTDAAGQPMVWVYDDQLGQARRRGVVVGAMRPDGIEVVSGLAAGERVIVSGLAQLREGLKVRPLEP
ncbi:efflux RND transporter periplasmic adaptor subunit [Desulfonatronum parangueonense]